MMGGKKGKKRGGPKEEEEEKKNERRIRVLCVWCNTTTGVGAHSSLYV